MQKIRLILKTTISIVCILLLVLPFSGVYFGTTEDNGAWQSGYILEDKVEMLFYLPFVILWFGNYFLGQTKLRRVVAVLLPLLTLPLSYISYLMLTFPTPDNVPSYGVFISLLLPPLVTVYVFFTQLLK